ncbi:MULTISPECIES: hypothetical protein [Sutcliffiella]|nr:MULTISPECIES: hypothetical protein [Sutcliffiella]WBL15912.1 hypothetical protein O1A01_04465 [Sutcliffiella sp. NC1]
MFNDKKVICPRCHIPMDDLYERSFGAIETVNECPMCNGLVQV